MNRIPKQMHGFECRTALRSQHLVRRICAVLFPILFVISPAAGQQTPIDRIASEILTEISHSKGAQRSLLVCDFIGPDATLTALGVKLADDLNASLAQSGAVQLADRSQITGLLHSVGLEREAGGGNAGELATAKLKTDGYISGKITLEGDQIGLSVYLQNDIHIIEEFKVSLPIDAEMKNLLATEIVDTPQSTVPLAGHHGYSEARCVFCPNAPFSDFDAQHGIQGTVLMVAVVGTDGKLTDIRVIKGLPGYLDSSAVQTVRTWKLRPVVDRAGKRVPARQIIEVKFHLSN